MDRNAHSKEFSISLESSNVGQSCLRYGLNINIPSQAILWLKRSTTKTISKSKRYAN